MCRTDICSGSLGKGVAGLYAGYRCCSVLQSWDVLKRAGGYGTHAGPLVRRGPDAGQVRVRPLVEWVATDGDAAAMAKRCLVKCALGQFLLCVRV